MSKITVCDGCGEEIKDGDNAMEGIRASLYRRKRNVPVTMFVYAREKLHTESYVASIDVCKYCFADAVGAIDDRPKAAT